MSQIIKEQHNEQINHIIDKNKKLLIFDMDGTLLDSMGFWQNLGRRYLESKGKAPENNLEKIIESMTLKESASYFKTKYNLEEDVETIIKQVLDFIEDKYLNEIPLKKGVKDFLIKAHSNGYKMCILTTSEKSQAIGALKRTGVLDLFDAVYTDRDFDLSKKNPQIYIKTCEKMDELPSDTVVFEDALYAVESAKKAQCTVIAVYDEYSKCDWQNIKNIANSTIDWR
ncbi:MAG: HAD family hydrolase [Intestinibacter bartlettii]|uniref:HAD family hydrolase n=1 Tax=Intestinibacter bartlettii TaxID=261299 RepID=UPI0039A3EF70